MPMDKMRAEYAEALASELVLDLKRAQVIKFNWGQDDSPVHSEPDITTDRVFISIFSAVKKEIRNICEYQGQEV